LENDIAAVRNEHETQDYILAGQKTALDGIIADISALRFMGKEPGTASVPHSGRATPVLDSQVTEAQISVGRGSHASVAKSEGETESVRPHTETAPSEGLVEEETDIEMGEVEEDPKDKNKKKDREEMEEGEATDASSELSEPPDD
jgi:THO complex subunit 7